MCAFAIKRSFAWAGLQWGLMAVCSAQTLPGTQLPGAAADEDVEILPRYEIEVIAFAYHDFDPAEEKFDDMPRGSLLDLLNPTLLETHERADRDLSERLSESLLSIDDEQPTLIPTDPSDRPESFEDLFGPPEAYDASGQDLLDDEESESAALEQPYPVTATGEDAGVETEPDPFAESDLEYYAAFAGEYAETPADEVSEEEQLTDEESTWYRILTSDELELTGTVNRLERLDAYTPLIHGGWSQEGLPEEAAIPFDLSLLGRFNPLGTVQLHVSRFLHVTVALRYQSSRAPGELPRAVDNNLEEITFPPRYDLHIQRRTRSGELHFFDHPAFGVLVLVRPAPEEPETTEDNLAPAA
jgi:hypothetical protein